MAYLIEFKNKQKELLRGIVDKSSGSIGIMCMHGFERTSVERKFKQFVDKLKGKASFFRFDFAGCGLSDGSFENITVEKMTKDFASALAVFKRECPKVKKIHVIAHSVAGCVVLNYLAKRPADLSKIILFGPAFNQRALQRFWFVKNAQKDREITWSNYTWFLDERAFQNFVNQKRRMSKEHVISNKYYKESAKKDYQDLFNKLGTEQNRMLIIHGDKDDKAPLESNDKLPRNMQFVIVPNGDHDLHRPDMVKTYLGKAIRFLSS